MRVLQLGVGSVGEVTARTMATEPEVTKLVLADIDEARLAQVAPKLPAGKVETMQIDVHDKDALVKALVGVDLVVNGLIPEVNPDVMAACLETNTNYLDMAAAGPRDIVGTADVDEELALDGAVPQKGLTALAFFGIDPGASDVFARCPLRPVRHGGKTHRPRRRQLQRRRGRFRPQLLTDHHGGGVPHPAAACFRERQDHPSPVALHVRRLRVPGPGRQAQGLERRPRRVAAHAPVPGRQGAAQRRLLHRPGRRLGQPAAHLAQARLRPQQGDRVRAAPASGRSTCSSAACPSLSTSSAACTARCAWARSADGTIGGKHVRRFMYQITSHDDAFTKFGVQGTGFQTGVPAACAALLLVKGILTTKGVLRTRADRPARRSSS